MKVPNPKSSVEYDVSVNLVIWNSLRHLPLCLKSLYDQKEINYQILIVDNASIDDSINWLKSNYPQSHILRNTRNVGFCRAHNQAIRLTRSRYVLILNPDVILSSGWLSRAVRFMDQNPGVAGYGGKLRRFEYSNDELRELIDYGIIDSTGLQLHKNRKVTDRGSGEPDSGQYSTSEKVFGISGACLLIRRTALESVRIGDSYFDERFFAYKEDVDLSWRLQKNGWDNFYDADNIAWHYRSVGKTENKKLLSSFLSETRKNKLIAGYSYRNHLLLLLKHETLLTFLRDSPRIITYELSKAVYMCFRHPWQFVFGLIQIMKYLRRGTLKSLDKTKVDSRTVRNSWAI